MQHKDLKKHGLKVTAARVKILDLLEKHKEAHLSAEDVYKKMLEQGEEVGLATVYRVLTQFESAGIIKRHHFEGGHSVYEMDEGLHHDHMVCLRCGEVTEFVDEIIEERQEKIARDAKFTMTDHSLTIYGVCRACSV